MPSNHARWLQSLVAASRRAARPTLIALAGCAMTSTAAAGDCWHDFWATYRANNAWPAPYVYLDRATVTPMLTNPAKKGTLIAEIPYASKAWPAAPKLVPNASSMGRLRGLIPGLVSP